jgi:hypothetical protein
MLWWHQQKSIAVHCQHMMLDEQALHCYQVLTKSFTSNLVGRSGLDVA